MWHRLPALILVSATLAMTHLMVVRPWFMRWDATDHEVARSWPGDKLWMYPPDRAGGMGYALIARVVPNRALILATAAPGSAPTAIASGNVWSFILEPVDARTTRLVMRGRGVDPSGVAALAFARLVFEPVHFVMERKMTTTIKALAEGRQAPEWPEHVQAALWMALGLL